MFSNLEEADDWENRHSYILKRNYFLRKKQPTTPIESTPQHTKENNKKFGKLEEMTDNYNILKQPEAYSRGEAQATSPSRQTSHRPEETQRAL